MHTIMTIPREITLNAISLTCGFAGNLLLLLHFVGRVRYIVALPLSIVFWLLASGIVSTKYRFDVVPQTEKTYPPS